MHVLKRDGPVTPFTDTGWRKFVNALFLWKDLGTTESAVAEQAVLKFKLKTQVCGHTIYFCYVDSFSLS